MAAFRGMHEGQIGGDAFVSDMPLVSDSDAHSRVELHFRCEGLKKMDFGSKSDPFCVVYIGETEVGRTEVVKNTQAPIFAKSILVDYFFEELQQVSVVVYDEDRPRDPDLRRHDLQGQATFAMGELMSSRNQTLSRLLVKGKRAGGLGSVVVTAEEATSSSEFLSLRLKGSKLLNKDGIFGKSDPFFVIYRSREDGSYVSVYRSVHVMNNLSPAWPVAKRISIQSLCNGDYDRPLRLEVWDWNSNGTHDFMGSGETSVRALVDQTPIPLVETKKSGKRKSAGTIQVQEARISKYSTFLDYIKGGWELNMVMGVDFTGSNGNPADPASLHYIDVSQRRMNQYERTIRGLASVLRQYDQDQLFPVYGFGGRSAAGGKVSHCFPLNGNPKDPYVQGVEGVIHAYHQALTQWGLSGPTVFSQIINATANMCRGFVEDSEMTYTILLIITDGVITDLEATKTAIVAASDLPFSIIIVGVGDSDFSAMEALDSDDQRLSDAHGRVARRDIVQFVRFLDFATAPPGRLAKETLVELPHQMLGYFTSKGLPPPPPKEEASERAAAAAPAPGPGGRASPKDVESLGKSLLKKALSGSG
uniref:C2 domain-containing protein n=1 Tax=Rhizochromulina marina TaxID=1034831 RepID=A0A7S2SLX7_9STRA|mmetsp:Transcript_32222/g.93502  ORF Transcript_32222/g.93502 Transcript_32222/m.93502 type:complete len:589 (+) Transcript_32222:21-1787(+)